MTIHDDRETKTQLAQTLSLLEETLGSDLLAVYLYGSAVAGGLQAYSDLDIFVVSNRQTTENEKRTITKNLLQISGVYQKSSKRPIELTLDVESEIRPWFFPPHFDFQYGEWLRPQFDSGDVELGNTKEMPDLALLITQVLLASQTLRGVRPEILLPIVPYTDFMKALALGIEGLIGDIDHDTRNVLLTCARKWYTVDTDTISSKQVAASWVISRLPESYKPVLQRALAISTGQETEHWDDLHKLVRPCLDFMIDHIKEQLSSIASRDNTNHQIKISNSSITKSS